MCRKAKAVCVGHPHRGMGTHVRAVARAMVSPKYCSTTLSDMSIPASVPAEVNTRPSCTKCLSYLTTDLREGVAHRIEKAPISCCPKAIQQSGRTEQ